MTHQYWKFQSGVRHDHNGNTDIVRPETTVSEFLQVKTRWAMHAKDKYPGSNPVLVLKVPIRKT